MEDSKPSLANRTTGYYEDEDWSPNEHRVRENNVIITRSKTNKLPPLKKTCYDVSVRVPLNSSSKNVVVGNKTKCRAANISQLKFVDKPSRAANSGLKQKPTISAYELQVQKNIEERKKVFEMLQLGNVKQEFNELFSNPKRKLQDNEDDGDGINNQVVKKRGRPNKEEISLKKESQPFRMSLRERQNTKFLDYLDESKIYVGDLKLPKSYSHTTEEILPNPIPNSGIPDAPIAMSLRSRRRQIVNSTEVNDGGKAVFSNNILSLKSTYVDQNSTEEFTKFVHELISHLDKRESGTRKRVPDDLCDFVKVMKSFELSSHGVPSVVTRRITSLTWHPNTSRPLIAVGDIIGSIGLWDIDHESETLRVTTHDIHTSHVTGLTFDKFSPLKLISTSRDGFVRLLDFSSGIIDEIYSIPKTSRDSFPIYHIQKNPSSLIVSRADGKVVTIDMRTMPTQVDQQFQCFKGSILTLSPHPLDENLFMASCVNGEISMFDLRYMQSISSAIECTDPVYRLPHVVSQVSGAFYSPLTGSYALVTAKNAFEVLDLRTGVTECQKTWDQLCPSHKRPVLNNVIWHPNREDMCLASKNDSQYLEVIGVPNGEHLHNFIYSKNCRQLDVDVNAFHPFLPMLARGSRTNGRVYLYCPSI